MAFSLFGADRLHELTRRLQIIYRTVLHAGAAPHVGGGIQFGRRVYTRDEFPLEESISSPIGGVTTDTQEKIRGEQVI